MLGWSRERAVDLMVSRGLAVSVSSLATPQSSPIRAHANTHKVDPTTNSHRHPSGPRTCHMGTG